MFRSIAWALCAACLTSTSAAQTGYDLAPPGGPTTKIANPPTPTGPWKRATLSIPTCSKPPVIDGRLDDECWPQAAHVVGFYRFASKDPV